MKTAYPIQLVGWSTALLRAAPSTKHEWIWAAQAEEEDGSQGGACMHVACSMQNFQ